MNEEARELLRDDILPLVLGHGVEAHRFASRMLTRYGVACMLCGERKNLLDWVDLNSSFLPLSRAQDARLAVEQLMDFAEANQDRLLLLIPMDGSDRAWIEEQAELLETRFVCVAPNELESGWLNTLKIR